jgi:predicted nucleotidyltransferase
MRSNVAPIADLLFGQTRGRVLGLLYGTPDESFYVRQISREIATSVGSVQRELTRLAGIGLIERSVLGSQVFYRANRENPVFQELRATLAKTTGVFHLLKTALSPLSARIEFAFVYGSVARAEDTASSDIDLMVVGNVSLDEVLDAIRTTEKYLRRPVNPTIYSLDALKLGVQSGNHFLRTLERGEKVFLIGGEDEFREAIATRLVQN